MAVQRIKDVAVETDSAQLAGFGIDILTAATITSSGHSNTYYVVGASEVDLFIIISAATGTPDQVITFSLNGDLVNTVDVAALTDIGTLNSVSGAPITSAGTQTIVLSSPIGDYVTVAWTVTGMAPQFDGVFVRMIAKGSSGTITVASNQVAYSIVNSNQVSASGIVAQLPDQPCVLALIKNDDGNSAPIYIGGSTVTTATGFRLSVAQSLVVTVSNTNVLYAITGGASCTLDILTFS